MRIQSPSPSTPTRRTVHLPSVSNTKRARTLVLLGLITMAGAALASTASSAGSLRQMIFGGSAGGGADLSQAIGFLPPMMAAPAPQGPASLISSRRGHTATSLADGRVLIVGGDNASGGYLGEAEVFDPVAGTFSSVGSMGLGRSDHGAVKLADGTVLITGGRSGIGTTNTTEIFNPATGTFANGPAMGVARAGHSATLFADGRVFIAGGDANGSAEVLDPSPGSFSAVAANMATARSFHSAALLHDGRVLIVGGRDAGGNSLSSGEVFDPSGSSFSAAGELTLARVLPHLRVLFDGKVQIIGGNSDESMEIYDPQFPGIGAYVHVLPETDTCTGLRPGILTSETRAALFHNGQSDPLLDRSGHTISELTGSTQALVAGGVNSSGSVLDSISTLSSSSASISTDKMDYMPGETATISGRGFQPGEIVRLKIHEDPHTPQERGFDATADAAGNFAGEYLVQDYDLDMKFIVSARGLTSGWTAHTTFTDANNDAHVAPGWAPVNTVTTFSSLYRVTTGGTVQNVKITLPGNSATTFYTGISVAATAFSSGTWDTPVVTQPSGSNPGKVQIALTSGTGLAVGGWARIDITTTTPQVALSGNPAEWLMQTFTNTAGTAGEQNDNPPVLIGNTTNPAATITFLDNSLNPVVSPVLQNAVPSIVRVRLTSIGSGIKYTDVAVPTCFSSPTSVTASVSAGGGAYDTPVLVTDGFIRLSGGSIANNGTLTVQFTTTPNCTSGTYLVSSDPSTNASNPPSGTNQSVSTSGGSLTVAAGLADLSITKTDSPDPVTVGGMLTYTIGVTNAGPNDASAVKVVDTLPAGTTFVSATALSNWSCNHASGTVTCNRTGGNLAPGAAPNITIVVTAPATAGLITNTATVSSPNDNTSANNTATAQTTVVPACTAPSITGNPVGQTITYGANATFSAAASGNPAPTVQWQVQVGGVGAFSNLSNGAPYSGVTTGTLTITSPTVSLSGNKYRAVFTNTCGGTQTATTTAATLAVNPKSVTANVTAANKTYDGNTTASITGCTLTGVLAGDTANVTCAAAGPNTFPDANVGNGKTVTATNISLSGSASSNYSLSSTSATTTANITTKAITATLTANDKTYDGNNTEPDASMSCSVSGVLPADTANVQCTATSGTFNTPNVATANLVTATVTISGTASGNYTLGAAGTTTSSTSATDAANITPKTLTASIIGNPTKTYDGNTNASLTSANFSLSGLIGSESFTVTKAIGTYNSADVASATTVTTSLVAGDFTPGAGTMASNYVLPTTATGPGQINKANAVVNVTPYSVTYDGIAHIATYTISGVNGETGATVGTVDVSGTTHINAGSYLSDPWSFTGAANYNNSNGTVDNNIDKANASFTVTPYNVTYDGFAHTATVSTISGVNGETGATVGTVNVSGTTHINAGSYLADPWSFTGAANYNNSNGTVDDNIDKANASFTVTPYSVIYDGFAHTATVSAISGVNGETGATVGTVNVSGTTHINAGSYLADPWSFTGAANYNNSNGTVDDNIDKANASFTVTPYNVTYDGFAHTATVSAISGVNGETGATVGTVDVSGTTHTNAGSYPGDPWSFTGAANYNNSNGTVDDNIDKANASFTVTPYNVTYDGFAHTATVSTISGVNGETGATVGTVNVSGTTHTNAGSYLADPWSFTGAANYNNSNGTVDDNIDKRNTSTTVTASPNPSNCGDEITITATVVGTGAGAGNPSGGSVQFKIDGANYGASVALVGTQASTSISTLTAGDHTVQAVFTSADTNFNGSTSAEITATVYCPDISVTKTAGASPISAGDSAAYTILVKNEGLGIARSVTVTDTLPAGVVWSTSSAGCMVTGGNSLSCTFGDLNAGDMRTVNVSGTTDANDCGSLNNTANASATNEAASTLANNESSASITVNCPDLVVSKGADLATVNATDQIGFTITVSNNGLGIARSVMLNDTLPNSGLVWTEMPNNPDCTISDGALTCSFGDLAAGATRSVHITSPTTPDNCGAVNNTASATATNEANTGNNSSSASITINCPDLVVSKTADASPVDAGNPIGFKMTVSNTGPGLAKGVSLSDTLPSNPGMVWTIDVLNSDGGCMITGTNSLSCSFGNLGNGSMKKVHVTSPTTPANCGGVSNTATTSAANERTSDIGNNSSTASIVLNDATAPTITLNGQTKTLWSPNHKYETVKVTDLVASAADSCSTALSISAVYISKVTSDEQENINSGDGNTFKDMVIANDCKSVDLRAERDGSKNGRVYTITFKVKDIAGNVGTITTKVTVPHSQGPKGVAVDDGPIYTVTNPNCP